MNRRKQVSVLLMFFILFLSFPATAFGKDMPQVLITSGYTEEGIY